MQRARGLHVEDGSRKANREDPAGTLVEDQLNEHTRVRRFTMVALWSALLASTAASSQSCRAFSVEKPNFGVSASPSSAPSHVAVLAYPPDCCTSCVDVDSKLQHALEVPGWRRWWHRGGGCLFGGPPH